MKKNKNFILALIAIILFQISFTSCDRDKPTPEVPLVTTGAYILNNGSFGQNNASLSLYNPDTKELSSNIFEKANNGKKLGDTAQDMVVYGKKMYIAVYNSKMIFVTDTTGKIIKEITHSENGNNLSPRMFTTYKNKVYVTYFEGYLAEIDTATFAVKTIKVGSNPEDVAVANGKIYVANSGGMDPNGFDKTLSVIDPISFTQIKKIDVGVNPNFLATDSQNDLYIITMGNYTPSIPKKLQKVDTKTDVVSDITTISDPTWMYMGANDKLYIISSVYDEYYNTISEFYTYNAKDEVLEGKFITDGTKVEKAYYISADPISGNVYIGSSDYKNNGDMYVFNSKGVKIDKFDTQGINPIGVYFLTNK